MNIELQALAAAHRNRSGTVRVGYIGVIREGIGNIEGGTDRYLRTIWIVMRMDRVPRLCIRGQKIGARTKRGNLITSEIIGLCAASGEDLVIAAHVIVVVKVHGGVADRLADLVQHFAC